MCVSMSKPISVHGSCPHLTMSNIYLHHINAFLCLYLYRPLYVSHIDICICRRSQTSDITFILGADLVVHVALDVHMDEI